jgi:parallel beta-helix repeat protein
VFPKSIRIAQVNRDAKPKVPANTSIGTWDSDSRTHTLTTDVRGRIIFDQDFLVLDAGRHGIFLDERTGVTLKNVTFQGCYWAFILRTSSDCTVTGNIFSNCSGYGIAIGLSINCIVKGNIVSDIGFWGIIVHNGSDNGEGNRYNLTTTQTPNNVTNQKKCKSIRLAKSKALRNLQKK